MKTLLLGIGSKARIGKDFAASELQKLFDLERIAFADELKKDLAEIFKKSGVDLWSVEKSKIRNLLVEYGETMRKFEENVWVRRALEKAKFDCDITFITDVRYPNEVKMIKDRGGYYIDITTDIPPANDVEAFYSPQMAKLADFKVVNNFDMDFISDLIGLISTLRPDLCQIQSKS